VTALCALHNFIRYRDPHELREFDSVSQSYDDCFGVAVDVPQPASLGGACVSSQEKNRAEVFRDGIAESMWVQYQSELACRRQRWAQRRGRDPKYACI
jgi:hypothetical protein